MSGEGRLREELSGAGTECHKQRDNDLTELRRMDAEVPVLIIAHLLAMQADAAQPAELPREPFSRFDVVSAIEQLRQLQRPR